MVVGHDGRSSAPGAAGQVVMRRCFAVALAALAFGTLLAMASPTSALAGSAAAPVAGDVHSTDPRHGGGGHGTPGPSGSATVAPTPVPTVVPTIPSLTTATSSATASDQPNPDSPAESTGAQAGVPMWPPAGTGPVSFQSEGDGAMGTGESPPSEAPQRNAVPGLVPGVDPATTARGVGVGLPLGLIAAAVIVMVLTVVMGLVVMLRDRDRQPATEGLAVLEGLGILSPASPGEGHVETA